MMNSMDTCCTEWLITVVTGITLLCQIPVVGSSTLSLWLRPCHGTLSSDQEISITETNSLPDPDHIISHRLWLKTNYVTNLTIQLRDLYAMERIESEYFLQLLNRNTTASRAPYNRNITQQTHFLDVLKEDYTKTVVAAVDVYHLRQDEIEFPFTPSFLSFFDALQSKLYALLCTLSISIRNKGGLVPIVPRDRFYSYQRSTTYAELHTRDYVVLRELGVLFSSITQYYEQRRHVDDSIELSVNNV